MSETGSAAEPGTPNKPMNFADLEGWLGNGMEARGRGWIKALPLLPTGRYANISVPAIAFLLRDTLKSALCDALRDHPIEYRNAGALTIGSAFEARRARIATLHNQINALEAQREQLVQRLAELRAAPV